MEPATTAMLVVELQNDLCAPTLTGERGLRGALARAVEAAGILRELPGVLDACRARGIPVVYASKIRRAGTPSPAHPPVARMAAEAILIQGSAGAAVVDAVAPQHGDVVLERLDGIDPSADPRLWETLAGARTLVVAGISTTLAVEGVVRAAANRGLEVVVLSDCCASVPAEWHRFSVENILPLLATITTAAAFVGSLP